MRIRRGHNGVRVIANDSSDQLRSLSIAGHYRTTIDSRFAKVQPQIRLPTSRIRPMASEAILRKNRSNMIVEANGGWRSRVILRPPGGRPNSTKNQAGGNSHVAVAKSQIRRDSYCSVIEGEVITWLCRRLKACLHRKMPKGNRGQNGRGSMRSTEYDAAPAVEFTFPIDL